MFKAVYTIPVKTNCLDNKDSVDEPQKPGVYHIPCECGLVYIGETGQKSL